MRLLHRILTVFGVLGSSIALSQSAYAEPLVLIRTCANHVGQIHQLYNESGLIGLPASEIHVYTSIANDPHVIKENNPIFRSSLEVLRVQVEDGRFSCRYNVTYGESDVKKVITELDTFQKRECREPQYLRSAQALVKKWTTLNPDGNTINQLNQAIDMRRLEKWLAMPLRSDMSYAGCESFVQGALAMLKGFELEPAKAAAPAPAESGSRPSRSENATRR